MLVVIQEHEKLGFFIFLKIASIPSHRSSSEDVFHLSKDSKHFDIFLCNLFLAMEMSALVYFWHVLFHDDVLT